jgi:hypothetical protein
LYRNKCDIEDQLLPNKKLLNLITLTFIFSLGVLQVYSTLSSTISISSYGSIKQAYHFVVALDGSGDFTDIQSAIDAVPASANGIIEIKEGLYDLNPNLKYPYKSIVVKSNLIIRGAGIDRTIIRSFPTKQQPGSSTRAMSITSQGDIENLVIEDLTVIQNGSPDNLGWSCIDLRGGSNTNVVIRNVKVTDVTGAGIAVPKFNNLVIENCIIENVWTGIALNGGTNGLIKGNKILNTAGDGIFPQTTSSNVSVTDTIIENNYLENIGDTGIDITSVAGRPPHERIIAQRNTLKNASIRVSYAYNIKIIENVIENSSICIDAGQGTPINITVGKNKITTSGKVGIAFYGAQDSQALNNEIYMTTPAQSVVQSGISAAIWSNGVIEGNVIAGAANYGINFAGWRVGGGSQITIRGNTLIDFGDIGIYDDGLNQGPVLIENNTIWDRHNPFISRYGIRTDYESNKWTIRYNRVYAGSIAYISAPKSNVYGNTYEPPS